MSGKRDRIELKSEEATEAANKAEKKAKKAKKEKKAAEKAAEAAAGGDDNEASMMDAVSEEEVVEKKSKKEKKDKKDKVVEEEPVKKQKSAKAGKSYVDVEHAITAAEKKAKKAAEKKAKKAAEKAAKAAAGGDDSDNEVAMEVVEDEPHLHSHKSFIGESSFASATTDTGFKHLLASDNTNLLVSMLNALVPAFVADPIVSVLPVSGALPILKAGAGERQQLMDIRVRTENGLHVLVEMQARRHVSFDERALFYAASTYARQLNDKQLQKDAWFVELRPVVAVQILDYDTNRVRGIKGEAKDTLVSRVQGKPMKAEQYLKNYMFTDELSGQTIQDLQLVQIELPRADAIIDLFPPRASFTSQHWWLSLLSHADDYTDELINTCKFMPCVIRDALMRLRLLDWGTYEVKEYKKDLLVAEHFASVLLAERTEGKAEGKAEGKLETLVELVNRGLLSEAAACEGLTEEESHILHAAVM